MQGERQRQDDQTFAKTAIHKNRLMLDAAGRIVGGDAAAFQALGQAARAAIGRPLLSFLDTETGQQLSQAARRLQTGDTVKLAQPICGHTAQSEGGAAITLNLFPVRVSGAADGAQKAPQRVRYITQIFSSNTTACVATPAHPPLNQGRPHADHLLRTHLNTIIGYADLAREECAQETPHRRREQMEAIASAGRALAAAANRDARLADILNSCVAPTANAVPTEAPASNLEAGAPCWIDLSSALSEARIRALRTRATHQRAQLTVDLEDAPRRVIAGRARLKAAIEALCHFAIDTVGGGGRVLLHVAPLDDGGVAIDIVDDGPGWRLSPNTPMPKQLKDLLSHVRAMMAADNARVEFQSAPGAGSTARIAFLPESVID